MRLSVPGAACWESALRREEASGRTAGFERSSSGFSLRLRGRAGGGSPVDGSTGGIGRGGDKSSIIVAVADRFEACVTIELSAFFANVSPELLSASPLKPYTPLAEKYLFLKRPS